MFRFYFLLIGLLLGAQCFPQLKIGFDSHFGAGLSLNDTSMIESTIFFEKSILFKKDLPSFFHSNLVSNEIELNLPKPSVIRKEDGFLIKINK